MKQYVALLRGINVGGNKKVEMERLREVFEKLGFDDVSTYINSGNVIFSAEVGKVDAVKIEKAITKEFGFEVRTLVRTKSQIEKIVKDCPIDWTNDKDAKTDVLFLWEGYDSKKSVGLIATNEQIDELMYVKGAGAVVWHIQKKNYGKSGMNKFIGTEIYKNMTARNINTVRKLAGLMMS